MLNDHDLTWLMQQLVGTSELLGQQITPTAAAMLADDLSRYPREVLARALGRVRTEHTGRLTPKVILDRIDEALGRPAANEAWAIASLSLDEHSTVVWNNEMASAMGVARPLATAGDMVGARMAFIGAYERLVRTAREERRLPEPVLSLGWSVSGRAAAVEEAVVRGLITHEQGRQLLPAPERGEGAALVAGLLAGPDRAPQRIPEHLRERFAQLRAELVSRAAARATTDRLKRAEDASDFEHRKAGAQRATDEYLTKTSEESPA